MTPMDLASCWLDEFFSDADTLMTAAENARRALKNGDARKALDALAWAAGAARGVESSFRAAQEKIEAVR